MSVTLGVTILCSVLNGLTLPFTVWFTYRTVLITYEQHYSSKTTKKKKNQKNRSNDAQFTVVLTGVSSVFICVGQMNNLLFSCFMAERIQQSRNGNVYKHTEQQQFIGFSTVYLICFTGGYIGVLLVCFERMRRVFQPTRKYRLEKCQIRSFHIALSLLFINVLSISAVFLLVGRAATVFVSITLVLGYSSLSGWVSYSFFVKTLDLSQSLDCVDISSPRQSANDHGQSPSVTNDIPSKSRRSVNLMDSSLRLTIVSSIAISSSIIGIGSVTLFTALRSRDLFFIGIALHNLDFTLNSLCLLSTLKRGVPVYRYLLGNLHDKCLFKLGVELGDYVE